MGRRLDMKKLTSDNFQWLEEKMNFEAELFKDFVTNLGESLKLWWTFYILV